MYLFIGNPDELLQPALYPFVLVDFTRAILRGVMLTLEAVLGSGLGLGLGLALGFGLEEVFVFDS